jgi:hypothetical protein
VSPDGPAASDEKLRLPLWTHQLVEYLLAVLIVTQSINGGRAATFIAVTGGLLFVLAATTDASMGAVRWIPPQLHRVLDVVVVAALVLAPIVSGTTEILAWVLCLLAATAVAWLNWHTRWTRPAPKVPRAPTAPAELAPDSPAPGSPAPGSGGASLGESARNVGKTIDRTTRGASRAAGRIYGRARARRPESGGQSETKT